MGHNLKVEIIADYSEFIILWVGSTGDKENRNGLVLLSLLCVSRLHKGYDLFDIL